MTETFGDTYSYFSEKKILFDIGKFNINITNILRNHHHAVFYNVAISVLILFIMSLLIFLKENTT